MGSKSPRVTFGPFFPSPGAGATAPVCGFLGYAARSSIDPADRDPWLAAGLSRLARRGPDDAHVWTTNEAALGFRRLAIMDLSDAGRQPMVSSTGRSVLVFNGELYGTEIHRPALTRAGYELHGTGDTEVLLGCLETWGVEETLRRLDGMFAFAWYRPGSRELVLARDHAGIKPLLFRADDHGVAFGSQLDVLVRVPWRDDPGAIDGPGLATYLGIHHLPAPATPFEAIRQVEPGSLVHAVDGRVAARRRWWQLPTTTGDLRGDDAVDLVAERLDAAVRRQVVADRPLGVFLSGGVDSPLTASLATEHLGSVEAYSLAVPGWDQDEADEAAAFAQALGVDHHVVPMTDDDALSLLDDVIEAAAEPFADFSIIPTLAISRAARRSLVVVVSGDGGDELFHGYPRSPAALRGTGWWALPRPLRLGAYALAKAGPWPSLSDVIVHPDLGDYYATVNSRLRPAERAALAPGLPPAPPRYGLYDQRAWRRDEVLDAARAAEFGGQLQRTLKKVDLASMHESLEVRVPFLDRGVIEAACSIAPTAHLEGGRRKAVLRDLLTRRFPGVPQQQRKLGFGVPLGRWLSGGLRERAETTLAGDLWPAGVFDERAIRAMWARHVSGERDEKWALWTVLALQWWAERHR